MSKVLLCVLITSLFQIVVGQEKLKPVPYESLEIRRTLFPEKSLEMAPTERDDFARNCAILAANKVVIEGRTKESLKQARKLLSLALQLNPRLKKAVVVNFQLSRNTMPRQEQPDYSPEVFAGLLHSVGRRLSKAGGKENIEMAGALLQLAADLAPKNEDVIYAQQLHEIDYGKFDWSRLEQQARIKPEAEPGPDEPEVVQDDGGI